MRPHALSLLVLSLSLLVPSAQAIYADEAYQNDYHHALLGTPQPHTTFFHQPSAASKASLLYTLSEKHVLGAVNPKDGAIVWRQYLKEGVHNGTAARSFLKAGEGENVIVSAVGGAVNAWDAADGRLAWAWETKGTIQGLEVLEMEGSNKDVVVVSVEEGKSILTRLAIADGQVVWTYVDESGDTPLAVSASATDIHLVSLHSAMLKGFKLVATTLDPVKATQTWHHTFNLDSDEPIVQIADNVAAPTLLWMEKSSKILKINVLGSKHVASINVGDYGKEGITDFTVHAPNTANAQPHFLVHYQNSESHWAQVYHIDVAALTVAKAYDLPRVGGQGAFSTSTRNANVYFTRNTNFEVTLVASSSHGILERWPTPGGFVDPEGVIQAVSEVVSKGGSSFAVRSAVTLSSGDWVLIRNGDPVWLRQEGLAGVVAAGWAEIPLEEDLAKELSMKSQDNILSAYVHRVSRHARDMKHFPGWVSKFPSRLLGGLLGGQPSSESQNLKRDGFGFRKVVIVATGKGRLMALDTGAQGRVIWNIQAVKLPPNTQWKVNSIDVGKDFAGITAADGEYLRIENLTGKIVQYQPGRLTPTIETFLIAPDASGEKTLVIINKDGSPSEPQAKLRKSIIVTRRSNEAIAGWSLTSEGKRSLAWEFALPPGESISELATRPIHDPVASIGRVLGDRNVLYKYLNPNLVLLVASSLAASTLSIYLLDAISGQILYTTTHSGIDASKPISTTFSENWFTYSLYSDPSVVPITNTPKYNPLPKGYQLVISELYESPWPNDRGPLGSAHNFSSLLPSKSPAFPHVISQSYVVPGPISRQTTTSTLQGITPRSLICILPSLSSLLSIPTTVLSPRRPVNRDPTSSEVEEGLFKYNPVLDFNPSWTISHQRELLGLKGVITTPTLMESTSLVFAYGDVDVFGTRVATIGTFDVLGKGFSRLQLVGTVLALGVGTAILAPMVRRKQVDGMWKS